MAEAGALRRQRVGPPEVEVVLWLKRALEAGNFAGRRASQVLVDQDPAYLRSRYRRQLKPTSVLRIGDWRPDLVCFMEQDRAERLVAFEVKGAGDPARGIVQASRYREGVHESYLCIPMTLAPLPRWLRSSAQDNGIGLVRAAPDRVAVDLQPAPPMPDPRVLQTTRAYILGQERVGALGLNKPLHYVAVVMALSFENDPWVALTTKWRLQQSAVRLATRGAETLGLISGGVVTVRGRAHADVLRTLGFDLSSSRALTRTRLAGANPGLAAVLRTMLLDHPAVDLIIQALVSLTGGSGSIEQVARRALFIDEGLALAVFGPQPADGESWSIRPTTRFQLKAALFDVGLIESPLARGASGPQRPGGYEPETDIWRLNPAFGVHRVL